MYSRIKYQVQYTVNTSPNLLFLFILIYKALSLYIVYNISHTTLTRSIVIKKQYKTSHILYDASSIDNTL